MNVPGNVEQHIGCVNLFAQGHRVLEPIRPLRMDNLIMLALLGFVFSPMAFLGFFFSLLNPSSSRDQQQRPSGSLCFLPTTEK